MITGVNGPKGPTATDKAKAKAKTGATGGANFADFLEEASASSETTPTGATGGVALGGGGFVPLEDDLPRDAQGQARELLKTLRNLAEDALSGSPTAAVGRLEQLANDMDESQLNPAQKQALDEVRTRAAVEVAKLKV